MKRVKYFVIQVGPDDINRLWREAIPAGIAAAGCRQAGSASGAGLWAKDKPRAEAQGEKE